jgi:putative flippase GtrA
MLITWYINRTLTFGRSTASAPLEWIKYVVATSAGAFTNYMVYAAFVALVPSVGILAAVAAGSFAGVLLNYRLANRLVFGNPSSTA